MTVMVLIRAMDSKSSASPVGLGGALSGSSRSLQGFGLRVPPGFLSLECRFMA